MTALALINRHAPRKAESGDERLSDLGMDGAHIECLRIDIEQQFFQDITDAEAASWLDVRDVSRTIERVSGRVGV